MYTVADVVALGYEADPTWTQKDLQRHMHLGPVLRPLGVLRMKASQAYKLFVLPGREAVRAIMQEAYALYLLACEPGRAVYVEAELRDELFKRTKRKVRKETSRASLLIQYVFAEMDDKRRHTYSKALEYAQFHNVSASAFAEFIKDKGGFNEVRELASKELATDPAKVAEQQQKVKDAEDAKVLAEQTARKFRNAAFSVQLTPQQARKLGPSAAVLYVQAVWDGQGNLEIVRRLPDSDALREAVEEAYLEEALGFVAEQRADAAVSP